MTAEPQLQQPQQQPAQQQKQPAQQQQPQSDYKKQREELERDLNNQLSMFVYLSSNGGTPNTASGSGDTKELAEKLTDVGNAFRALGKHKSELRYMQKALEMRKRLYDGDQWEIAESLLNLGIAYANCGEHKYALRYKLEALRMFKRLNNDEDHLSLADALYQVGLSYRYISYNTIHPIDINNCFLNNKNYKKSIDR